MEEKRKRIVVTGMGSYSSAGKNIEEFYQNLHHANTGIKECNLFATDGLNSPYFGQIDENLPKDMNSINDDSRSVYLMNELITQVMEDGKITSDYIHDMYERCQLSLATSIGVNEYIMGFVRNLRDGIKEPRWLADIPNFMLKPFQERCKIMGGYYINSAACTAGTVAAGTAITNIRCGEADMVFVCAVDPLSQFSTYGFHSLNNMSHGNCNPFDQNRDGITLGEGGAIFLFEEYEHAVKRNAKIYCEVYGYGIGNDAYHVTSPDPTGDGAVKTMQMALDDANISATDIDYVNAHGTGTEHNDSMETIALKRIFQEVLDKKIYVNSTKSYVGHCLAAAGGVELAATILTLCKDEVFVNAGLKDSICDQDNLVFVKDENVYSKIQYAISNSYAFAGNSASIVVGKVKEA